MTHDNPTHIATLLAIEQIKALKARYFRLMDTKQWDAWRNVFTDACVFDTNIPGPRDNFVAEVRARLGDLITVHHGHLPEIVLTGDETARGIWAMYDYVSAKLPSGSREFETNAFMGFGHYEEEYECIGGEWKISFIRLTRIRLDVVPFQPPVTGAPLVRATTNWLTTGNVAEALRAES
jgi:hypothetical protein